MFGKLKTGERQSARAAVDSDGRLDEQFRVVFKDFQSSSPQLKPGEDWHEVMVGIGRHLHNEFLALQTIYDRLLAIENQTKKRSSRGLTRYLLAFCVGAAATVAWLSYGGATKQIIATRAPELGWSPETKQMIANWVALGGRNQRTVLKRLQFPCRRHKWQRLRRPCPRQSRLPLPPSTPSRCIRYWWISPRWSKPWTSSPPVRTRLGAILTRYRGLSGKFSLRSQSLRRHPLLLPPR